LAGPTQHREQRSLLLREGVYQTSLSVALDRGPDSNEIGQIDFHRKLGDPYENASDSIRVNDCHDEKRDKPRIALVII
jgi:hypothetical protein